MAPITVQEALDYLYKNKANENDFRDVWREVEKIKEKLNSIDQLTRGHIEAQNSKNLYSIKKDASDEVEEIVTSQTLEGREIVFTWIGDLKMEEPNT